MIGIDYRYYQKVEAGVANITLGKLLDIFSTLSIWDTPIWRENQRHQNDADSLCILDLSGKILFVDSAWKSFAVSNGHPAIDWIGVNYRDVCRSAAGQGPPVAKMVADTIDRIGEGLIESQSFDYSCHAPNEYRGYRVKLTRFEFGGESRILVNHFRIA